MENIDVIIPVVLAEKSKHNSNLNYSMARADVISGLKRYRLWHYIAMSEMRRRYRRTIIGPFWTTLSIGIFIFFMSIVLSGLWKSEPKEFLPYFCSGYISWIFFSTLITEGCTTFISNEIFLKQLSIPYIIYACLTTWRNLIVFSHHLIILSLVLLYCQHPINFNLLYIIPALLIIFITGVLSSLLLGMLCARYRDIQQIIISFLQLAMFATPIMWKVDQLGRKGFLLAKFNIIFHYITILRMPLLGEAPPIETWVITITCTGFLGLVTFWLFSKKYRDLIYWL